MVNAARDACSRHTLDDVLTTAEPGQHVNSIYEGLGFERVELVLGAIRKPADS